MNDRDLLLKQITEETYQEDILESSTVSLVSYFEKRLNEVDYLSLKAYLQDEDILSLPINYLESTKCYRMILDTTVIDFPSNWSIFSKLDSTNVISLNALSDDDFLCEVFLSYVGEVKILVIAIDGQDSRIIFLNSEKSDKQLKWIENYFEKKEVDQEKKAA